MEVGGEILGNNGATLQLEGSGTYTNNGNIGLNSTAALTDLQLVGGGTVTLGGSGTVTMSNNANNRIYSSGTTTALVIGPNQLVQGAGQIGLGLTTVTNNGTTDAKQSPATAIVPNAA